MAVRLMRFLLVLAAALVILTGADPSAAKDCAAPRKVGERALPGCRPEAAPPLREDAVRAQQPPADQGDGTTLQIGGRVRGEAFGAARGR